jgi:hypothetical protein
LSGLALFLFFGQEGGEGNREHRNWEQGIGNREQGTGNREQGTGNREEGNTGTSKRIR